MLLNLWYDEGTLAQEVIMKTKKTVAPWVFIGAFALLGVLVRLGLHGFSFTAYILFGISGVLLCFRLLRLYFHQLPLRSNLFPCSQQLFEVASFIADTCHAHEDIARNQLHEDIFFHQKFFQLISVQSVNHHFLHSQIVQDFR